MAEPGQDVLLRAARAGDGEAFAALVEPHLDALHAFACRAGPGAGAADDIVQDTLLRAWRHLGSFRGDSAFRTWLFAIAWHAAKTEAARAARAPRPSAAAPDLPSPDPGPDEQVARTDLAERARAAIGRLTPGQRDALTAVDVHGAPLAEAAAALRIPLGTLKTNLHRGRRRLAALLGGRTGP